MSISYQKTHDSLISVSLHVLMYGSQVFQVRKSGPVTSIIFLSSPISHTITEPPFDKPILQAQFFTKYLDSFYRNFLSCIRSCV